MNNLFEPLVPSNDSSLWRFMDLFKFVDLITSNKLTLVNLTGMRDPYEGIIHSSIETEWVDLDGKPAETPTNFNFRELINNSTRQAIFISCWHENEFESAGMWDTYGDQNGIAIKTTVERLKKSIQFEKYKEMDLLRINYFKDINGYFLPNRAENHVYTGIINKRISFEHEKEIRLLWHPRDYDNKSIIRKIDIDIRHLVECIYVSPIYSKWQLSTIQNLLKKIGIDVSIKKSELYELK